MNNYKRIAFGVKLSGKNIPPPLSVSKLILIFLSETCDQDGISFASKQELKEFCESPDRKINLALKYLKRESLISDVFNSDGKKIATRLTIKELK